MKREGKPLQINEKHYPRRHQNQTGRTKLAALLSYARMRAQDRSYFMETTYTRTRRVSTLLKD